LRPGRLMTGRWSTAVLFDISTSHVSLNHPSKHLFLNASLADILSIRRPGPTGSSLHEFTPIPRNISSWHQQSIYLLPVSKPPPGLAAGRRKEGKCNLHKSSEHVRTISQASPDPVPIQSANAGSIHLTSEVNARHNTKNQESIFDRCRHSSDPLNYNSPLQALATEGISMRNMKIQREKSATW
jgi:hypothetical protein